MGDEPKRTILARRAKFIAAALAGVSLAACGKEKAPRPCLDVPPPEDAASVDPITCLTTTVPTESAPAPAADAGFARPCLEVMPSKPSPEGGRGR